MVVEGRGDQPRSGVQPAEHVALDARPRVLAPYLESITDGDLAGPDARPPVDLALAPPALPRVAHQATRPVEAEAARQDPPVRGEQGDRDRLALDALERRAVEGEADSAPWGVRR